MRSGIENTSSKSDQILESSLSEFLPNSENIWSVLATLFPEEDGEKETRYIDQNVLLFHHFQLAKKLPLSNKYIKGIT